MPTYTGQLGTLLRITVPSLLLGCRWSLTEAVVGGEVVLLIQTGYVGDGAPVDFRIMDEKGSTVAKLKGIVRNNIGSAKWTVSDKAKGNLFFFAEAKDVDLVGRSDTLAVRTLAAIGNLEATDLEGKALTQVQIGDKIRWTCRMPGVPDDTPFVWRIQCHQDAAHQTSIAAGQGFVKQGRGEIVWKSSYPFQQSAKKSQKELDQTSETFKDAFYQAHFSCLGVTARSAEVGVKTELTVRMKGTKRTYSKVQTDGTKTDEGTSQDSIVDFGAPGVGSSGFPFSQGGG